MQYHNFYVLGTAIKGRRERWTLAAINNGREEERRCELLKGCGYESTTIDGRIP